MDIETKVREKSGKPDWPIPLPESGKAWVRFYCPFCEPLQRKRTGRKSNNPLTAAINHDAQWFSCFRCGRGFGAYAASYPKSDTRLVKTLRAHKPLITRIVRKVDGKFGRWTDLDDLTSKAEELIWNYAYMPKGGKNDAGMWDDWLADGNGDPEVFQTRLGAALKGDLMNYAESVVTWKRKSGLTNVPADEDVIEHEPPNFRGNFLDYVANFRTDARHSSKAQSERIRTDTMGHYEYLFMLGAESERVKFTSWGTSILRCGMTRNGLGPVKDHCVYCDRALKPAMQEHGIDEWVKHYGSLYRGHWSFHEPGEDLR